MEPHHNWWWSHNDRNRRYHVDDVVRHQSDLCVRHSDHCRSRCRCGRRCCRRCRCRCGCCSCRLWNGERCASVQIDSIQSDFGAQIPVPEVHELGFHILGTPHRLLGFLFLLDRFELTLVGGVDGGGDILATESQEPNTEADYCQQGDDNQVHTISSS